MKIIIKFLLFPSGDKKYNTFPKKWTTRETRYFIWDIRFKSATQLAQPIPNKR